MDAREKLMQILDKPVFPEDKGPLEAVADYLLENDVVPVVHAHWKWKQFPIACGRWELKTVCSCCHKTNKNYEPPYCPYCGARMDGDTDD